MPYPGPYPSECRRILDPQDILLLLIPRLSDYLWKKHYMMRLLISLDPLDILVIMAHIGFLPRVTLGPNLLLRKNRCTKKGLP